MSKRILRPLLLVLVPIAVVVAAGYVWLNGGRFVTTENAYVKTHIAHVSSELDARIRAIVVSDHAHVKAGDVLIELDRAPFETARLKAEAEVDSARQEIRTLIAVWQEATSELAEAEGRLEYLDAQMERQKTLAKRGIVASTKLEDAEEELRQGRDRTRVMRQKVNRMLAQIGGDPKRDIDEHPTVREHLAALEQAKLDLERTLVRAPIDGQIVNLKLQPGEHIVATKPLMAIVADGLPWIEANFKETELTYVRPGMHASIVLDIFPDQELKAEVLSISPATGAEFALLPPQNASGNWVKVVQRLPVKLRLVEPGAADKIRAGMTATVKVDTERERSIAQLIGSWSARADGKAAQDGPGSAKRAAQ